MTTSNWTVLYHTKHLLVVQTSGAEAKNTTNDANAKPPTSTYGNFNLGLHVADNPAQVLANRARLLMQLNQYLATHSVNAGTGVQVDSIPQINNSSRINSIHWLNQVHGNHVHDVDAPSVSQSSLALPAPSTTLTLIAPNADAQITAEAHKALAVMTADCVPIVLYHPQTHQVAAIHAGWQGLANGVIAQTLRQLTHAKFTQYTPPRQAKQAYIVSPVLPMPLVPTMPCVEGWQAWIGACICQNCYEVSLDVVDKLLQGCHKIAPNINREHLRTQAIKAHRTDDNKAWLDLVAIASAQLDSLGVTVHKYHDQRQSKTPGNCPHNTNAQACSYGDGSYYSYRRMTHQRYTHTGRMALLIVRLS